jgi:subtilisin family serine protease
MKNWGVVAGLVVLAVSCGGGARQTLRDPFVRSGEKVRLSAELSVERVAVLLDERCVWEKDRSGSMTFAGQRLALSWRPGLKRDPYQTHRVSFPTPIAREEIERVTRASPCVRGVAEVQRAQTQDEGSSIPQLQTHLDALRLQQSEAVFFDPKGGIRGAVVIAMIDTGLDLTHPDLAPHLWRNSRESAGSADTDLNGYAGDVFGFNFPSRIGDPAHQTPDDHGTHTAGLAGAANHLGKGASGVMRQQVQIMVLNVFGKNWGTDTPDIDEAIRYAVANGANIINLSVGGLGRSDTTAAAIVDALRAGVTVVASAGNDGRNIDLEFVFPASYAPDYPGLISVAATDVATGMACSFSNMGVRSVKIAAPGCDRDAPKSGLLSTRRASGYGHKKGTSMAAPLVSGALALAYGMIRDRTGRKPTPAELENALMESASVQNDLASVVAGGRALRLESLAQWIERKYPLR